VASPVKQIILFVFCRLKPGCSN